MDLTNRKGRIKISHYNLRGDVIYGLKGLFSVFFPIQIMEILSNNESYTEYIGYSKYFEENEFEDIIPNYEAIFQFSNNEISLQRIQKI